jgi:DnaJ-class molecular chaperone
MNTPILTPQIIHSAFKTLAKKIHPDVNNNSNSTEKFQHLKEDYDKLCASLSKIYIVKISISLQDSILGCDRFFISNDGQRKFLLAIPIGIKDEDTIQYKNVQLDPNQFSILQVKIHIILPKNFFIINGKLIQTIRISIWKAFIGGSFNFFGPDGAKLKVILPKKLKNDSIFKIAKEGLIDRNFLVRNDLYVKFQTFFY